MILEAVPALPVKHRNGHHTIKRTSRHYAGSLPNSQARAIPTPQFFAQFTRCRCYSLIRPLIYEMAKGGTIKSNNG
jgi:hypothetical protein